VFLLLFSKYIFINITSMVEDENLKLHNNMNFFVWKVTLMMLIYQMWVRESI